MALSPFIQALLQPQDSVPYEGAAGPVDPLTQILAGLSDPGVAKPLANPGGVPVSPEADALGRRERAMADLLGSNVEPDKVGILKRIIGGLADASGAYGAGLQGRAAPPSTLEALRQRRLMAAEREAQTKRQAAGLQAQIASGDLSAARQDRRADERFTQEQEAADRRFRMGQEAQAERDEKMRRWTVEDITKATEAEIEKLRIRGDQRMRELEVRLDANDPAAQREYERSLALSSQRTGIVRRILFQDGKRGKVSLDDVNSAIDEYELVLDEAGVERGSDLYAEELAKMRVALYRHMPEGKAKGGGETYAEDYYDKNPETGEIDFGSRAVPNWRDWLGVIGAGLTTGLQATPGINLLPGVRGLGAPQDLDAYYPGMDLTTSEEDVFDRFVRAATQGSNVRKND